MRTCFICAINNEAVLKSVFREPEEKLTFSKAVDIATEVEEAAKTAKAQVYSKPEEVHKIQAKKQYHHHQKSSTTDREDEYFLNSCTSGLSICCGHPSRTYRFTSEMTGSLLVESFSWFLLYGCSCELMVLIVQTVSTSLSPSSPSKDRSGPAGSLLSASALPCCLVGRYSMV